VADLGLAANEVYKNKDGEPVKKTCFVDIVAWGRQAEACGQYLSKGVPVLVEGKLQLDQWETDDGQKRSKLRVRADRVQFLGQPRKEAGNGTEEGEGEGLPF
jgi:single-strand DNA-binding protein